MTGVWNRVSGLSSSHEQYKEKVAANIDGWMKLLYTPEVGDADS